MKDPMLLVPALLACFSLDATAGPPATGAAAHQHTGPLAEGHTCPAPSYVVATQGVELLPKAAR